uniref:U exon protein n=1 Tax=Psittacine aviadenovirus B TaxID=2169709 RepID=A0AB38ZPC5_9ADEN
MSAAASSKTASLRLFGLGVSVTQLPTPGAAYLTTGMSAPRKYWLKINDQALLRFDRPLNPGFVFWLRRRYRAHVKSDGGERTTVTRQEPFTGQELREIYSETDYRQQVVSMGDRHGDYQFQKTGSKAVRPL